MSFAGDDLPPSIEIPFLDRRGPPPGAWHDLDNPATLAWVNQFAEGRTIDEIVGPDTGFPFGFSIAQIMRLFFDTRALSVAVPYEGCTGGETHLEPFPSAAPRERLLFEPVGHQFQDEDFTTFFSVGFGGFLHEGRFYPPISCTCNWSREEPEPDSGQIVLGGPADSPQAGVLRFWGQTTPLREKGGPTDPESGDIEISFAAFWPSP